MSFILLSSVYIFFESCRNQSKDEKYETYVKNAIDYEKDGKYGQALEQINKAIQIDSTKSFAFICRGIIKSDQRQERSAIIDFSKAIQKDNRNTAGYFQKAMSFSQLSLNDSAVWYFNLAMQSKKYGDYYLEENYNKNLAYEKQVIPTETIRYNRGLSYYDLKEDSLAFEDFYYSSQKKYHTSSCYLYMGMILIGFGNKKTGCNYLEAAKKEGEDRALQYLNIYCK